MITKEEHGLIKKAAIEVVEGLQLVKIELRNERKCLACPESMPRYEIDSLGAELLGDLFGRSEVRKELRTLVKSETPTISKSLLDPLIKILGAPKPKPLLMPLPIEKDKAIWPIVPTSWPRGIPKRKAYASQVKCCIEWLRAWGIHSDKFSDFTTWDLRGYICKALELQGYNYYTIKRTKWGDARDPIMDIASFIVAAKLEGYEMEYDYFDAGNMSVKIDLSKAMKNPWSGANYKLYDPILYMSENFKGQHMPSFLNFVKGIHTEQADASC